MCVETSKIRQKANNVVITQTIKQSENTFAYTVQTSEGRQFNMGIRKEDFTIKN